MIAPWRRSSTFTAVVFPLMAASASVGAQGKTPADRLFDEGVSLMKAGKFEQGCPKIAESYRLDPTAGALFTVAECEAAWGKTATALEHYDTYIHLLTRMDPGERARHQKRHEVAVEKVAALSRLVPRLTIVVADQGSDGLVVKRNGAVVESSTYGVAVQVDPGTYQITAETPQGGKWERKVVVGKGQSASVSVKTPTTPNSAGTETETGPAPPPTEPDVPPGKDRTWAYVAGGVGLAGLTVGTVAGLLALGKKGTIQDNCTELQCNPEGLDAADSGQRFAMVSNIGFGVGIAGLAAATVLFFTAPDSEQAAARRGVTPVLVATPSGSWAGVGGAF